MKKIYKDGSPVGDTNQSFPDYDLLWLAYLLCQIMRFKVSVLSFSVKTFSVSFGRVCPPSSPGGYARYAGAYL